ncbi:hypothetical protein HMPREF0083_02067 [Aneurinibacillus aneurinilyticus ATCC 12856]|uniref:Uncharacterized protein n=1 Tax=Aneurinibacillus aneurinilyticus ATCC 12856 TaxID=649747 RepID=U1WMK3_ANEAE|nr:hypothetical protein HMPREF0083_02067 [Aneurinibacillus aneurinilyticus ATCC 12856]
MLSVWHRGWGHYHVWYIDLYRAAGHERKQSGELNHHFERFNHHVGCLLALEQKESVYNK